MCRLFYLVCECIRVRVGVQDERLYFKSLKVCGGFIFSPLQPKYSDLLNYKQS